MTDIVWNITHVFLLQLYLQRTSYTFDVALYIVLAASNNQREELPQASYDLPGVVHNRPPCLTDKAITCHRQFMRHKCHVFSRMKPAAKATKSIKGNRMRCARCLSETENI